ncbi:dTDP-4-dehydrorhamnose 3,5-epimerase [Candidatus Uhrbacteria bacterium CG_4_9_14_0_2_um_filter_41_50]|uniref:dTDP-4-dehydrorhamnose 3,5-epimerase n=1 Tax=Candidatus Uhrbacteria bacterium CG_4_9_14_0_2_um_filter_41_50 TaxID=1975031 RepID=A0A2M8ENT8_9BACT|nr:MAG: dTDP-4-dehydrorhamnose 3,5-epimerase [Candidatus Uhrbacteria bacterium CG_4_10_14_3_um_filter_41_21]PIZ55120.1 MAG: dTDP-4-dehydrorhamnose 3,5-epimerase [Candidatus Uhrbacteria bacterium CG_4_10_14_0_2_um_filter_41_21]PJB84450.1 MAG: dTDP-4-dehydrorhamnose 3,5-epimerase [Candidatus Uhrbacteria bacterium CG_4_9_14_0_8_um_filter_41_16]PJC24317.1 MAG: dTDP-4-dehydrorhamnose 3,5-epimerase [Candidatus Uhrbacteria bacterium CG_4_9_14_0_2_um_filter_41_50]PJE75320.1 MAG: dTDP-4-dehydrorhamnose 
MKKIETSIPDLFVIEPTVFEDERGFFFEYYNEEKFKEFGINFDFKQANHSKSVKGTLRGIHFQLPPKAQAKLVRCSAGRLWDVAVDLRPNSPTYKRWFGIELSATNKKMLFVPVGFGHGFYALEACELQYQVSNTFDKSLDAGVAYNDPELGIDWQISGDPILSEKDRALPFLSDSEGF